MGEGYVTVRSPADFADDGMARPVVLFELEGGETMACSAGRSFTERARRHIRELARSPAVVSVTRFRTRCPAAACLPSANRTRVRRAHGHVKTHWPAVDDCFADELIRMSTGKILCVWPATTAGARRKGKGPPRRGGPTPG